MSQMPELSDASPREALNSAPALNFPVVGIGASGSPTLAGYLADYAGSRAAFLGLTAIAVAAFVAVLVLMRETRPQDESQ